MKTKFGTAKLDNKGYYRINNGKEGINNKLLHRLIWEDWYGKLMPKGYVIHHINHIKSDNRIQNLQCVEDKKHRSYHGSNSEESKQILIFYAKQPKSDEHKKNMSKSRNKTGYLNVSKHKGKTFKQGFCWRYCYSENGKRKEIQRVNLEDLEKEVKRRNLNWKRFDDGGVLDIV